MKDFKEIKRILREKGIVFEEVHFTDTAISGRIKDTSKDKNYNPQDAIKTLLIETPKKIKAVILKSCDNIDKKKLKGLIGKWSIVDKDTLESEHGLVVGGICLLVLECEILIDRSVTVLNQLSMGAGDISNGIKCKRRCFF